MCGSIVSDGRDRVRTRSIGRRARRIGYRGDAKEDRDPSPQCPAKGLAGLRATGSETLQLVIDYVKQETLDPLKGLGRYLLFGVAGSVFLSHRTASCSRSPSCGCSRARPVRTFTGNLSWVPYVICTVVVVAVAALAVWSISRGQARSARGDKEGER